MDFYENPDKIHGGLDRARISSIIREWGLPSVEWTFVIDRKGRLHVRFEGFATLNELEEALQQML